MGTRLVRYIWRYWPTNLLYGGVPSVALTHWGRVTHICISKLTIIGSDNGLSPDRHQAIIWTNAGILLIGPLGTNFSEILIEIHAFSFKKVHLKMSSGKWRPFWLGLNVIYEGPRLHGAASLGRKLNCFSYRIISWDSLTHWPLDFRYVYFGWLPDEVSPAKSPSCECKLTSDDKSTLFQVTAWTCWSR